MDWELKRDSRNLWFQWPMLGGWLVCAGSLLYGLFHSMFFYDGDILSGVNPIFFFASLAMCIPAIPTAISFLYFTIEGLVVGVVFGMTPHQRLREKVRAIGPASFGDLTKRFGRQKEDRLLWALTDIRQGAKPPAFLGRIATRLSWLVGYAFCYGYPFFYEWHPSLRYPQFGHENGIVSFYLTLFLVPLQFPGLILILKEVWGVRKAHAYADAVLKEQRATQQQSAA